jgi:hypothetical protein
VPGVDTPTDSEGKEIQDEATTGEAKQNNDAVTGESEDNTREDFNVEKPHLKPIDERKSKSRSITTASGTLKRKKKLRRPKEKPTLVDIPSFLQPMQRSSVLSDAPQVEIPLCSHSQLQAGQDQGTFIQVVTNPILTFLIMTMQSMELRSPKPLSPVLSPADRQAADDILMQLLEIR